MSFQVENSNTVSLELELGLTETFSPLTPKFARLSKRFYESLGSGSSRLIEDFQAIYEKTVAESNQSIDELQEKKKSIQRTIEGKYHQLKNVLTQNSTLSGRIAMILFPDRRLEEGGVRAEIDKSQIDFANVWLRFLSCS